MTGDRFMRRNRRPEYAQQRRYPVHGDPLSINMVPVILRRTTARRWVAADSVVARVVRRERGSTGGAAKVSCLSEAGGVVTGGDKKQRGRQMTRKGRGVQEA